MTFILNDNFRRRLLGASPPWLVEHHKIQDDKLVFSGWALPPEGDLDIVTFLVNGNRVAKMEYGLPSPHLKPIFFYMKNAGYSHFICSHPLDRLDGAAYADIAFANTYTLQPFNNWHGVTLPLSGMEKLATPDSSRLLRTQGFDSINYYIGSGLTTALKLERILNCYFQRSFSEYGNLLDWGSGCGRVIQHFPRMGARMSLHAVDVDADNIAWCAEQIPHVFFSHTPLYPPMDFPDGFFDVIFSVSVLSNLSESTARAWLEELARVSKPGAPVIFALNAEYALARVSNTEIIEKTLVHGMNSDQLDDCLDEHIAEPEYYRSGFYTSLYIKEVFSRFFEVVDILPGANASVQDFVILKKL